MASAASPGDRVPESETRPEGPAFTVVGPAPARRPRPWPELLLIVWLCWVYDAIANLAPIRRAAATAHARGVLRVEEWLHLDPERSLDGWLVHHHTLAVLISNYYDNAHFVVTLGLVGWLWWRHPGLYRPLRTALVLTNVIAFVVFLFDPTAPPRLLDPSRYPDVVAATHAFGSWHSGTLATAADQLAAMPSLHIAWAVWSSLALWRVLDRRRWALAVWLYPVLTAAAVMATGNHFLLDVLAGAATLALAALASDRWYGWRARRRPGGAGHLPRAAARPVPRASSAVHRSPATAPTAGPR